MVNNNYVNCFAITGRSIKNVLGAGMMSISYSTTNITRILAGVDVNYRYNGSQYTWLDVGFGDTAETPSDYILADGNTVFEGSAMNPRAAGALTCVAYGRNDHGNRDFFSIYSNFTNNTGASLTVKEVGVIAQFGTSYTTSQMGLIMRKVLDTPITIAPGETYSFTYRLRLKDN